MAAQNQLGARFTQEGPIALALSPVSAAAPLKSNTLIRPQPVILTFGYGGLVNTYVTALYVNDSIYLPIHGLFSDLMVSNNLDMKNRTITGFYGKESNKYRIDFGKRVGRINGQTFSIDSSKFIAGQLDIYLLPSLYEKLFALKFTIDMSKLLLVLSTPVKLPIIQNYDRKVSLQYATQPLGIFRPPAPLLYPMKKYLLNGGVFDYTLSSFYSKGIPSYAYNLSAGGNVLGGEIEGTLNVEVINRNSTILSKTLNWRYVVNSTPLLTNVSLGNLYSSGLNQYDFRGIQISNTPVQLRKILGSYTINEKVSPGWETELYLNGERVGYSKADAFGNVHFRIPLVYGSSFIQLKSFGPNGQVSEEDRRLQIPFTLMPTGEFNYTLSAGELSSSNEKLVQANMEYGVADWLTEQVGVDYLQSPLFSRPLPYNSLTLRVGSPYIINLETAPSSLYQVSLNAIYPSQASFAVTYDRYMQNDLYNLSKSTQQISVTGYLPFYFHNNSLNFNFSGNGQNYEDGSKTLSYSVGANTNLWRLNLSTSYSGSYVDFGAGNPIQGRTLSESLLYSLGASSGPLILLNGALIGVTGGYDLVRKSMSSVRLDASDFLDNYLSLQFSVTKDFLNRFTSFNLQLTCNLPFIEASASSQVQQSQASYSQYISGSVAYDSHYGRFLFNSIHWVGQSGVTMRMYLDNNEDGKFDKGDEIIKNGDIALREAASSDLFTSGVIRAWNLLPYSQYSADIQSGTAQNPLWVPERKSFSFITDPNIYKPIDIPFYTAGVIEGSVRQIVKGKPTAVPGLELVVLGRSQKYHKTISAFNDGSLYYVGIPPGKYRIYVDPSQVAALGARSVPDYLNFTVKSKKTGDFIKGLNFVLKKAKPPAAIVAEKLREAAIRAMRYLIQLGAFAERDRARMFASELQRRIEREIYVRYNPKSNLYAVQLDTMKESEDAYQLEQRLIYDYGIRDAFVMVLPDSNVRYTFSVRLGLFGSLYEAERFASESGHVLGMKTRLGYNSPLRLYEVIVGAFGNEIDAQNLLERVRKFRQFSRAELLVAGRYIVDRYAVLLGEFGNYRTALAFASNLFNHRGIDALIDFDSRTRRFEVYTTPTPYPEMAKSLLKELGTLKLFKTLKIITVK